MFKCAGSSNMKEEHMKRIRKGLESLENYGGRSTGRSITNQRS